jgi:hypothetical protein
MSDDFRLSAEPYHDFADPTPRAAVQRDVYVTVIASCEIFFGLVRLAIVGLGVIGLSQIPLDNPLRQTTPFEIGSGLLLGVTGLVAAVLLLFKSRIGVAVGWLALLFVVFNLAVSLWQSSIMLRQFENNQPQFIGGLVGGGIVLLIRLGINAEYAVALLRAAKLYR